MADIADINNGESGSSVRGKLNSLIAKVNSNGELAYKTVTPSAIQQLELQTINSSGQYVGSKKYVAFTEADVRTILLNSLPTDKIVINLQTDITLTTTEYVINCLEVRFEAGEELVIPATLNLTSSQTNDIEVFVSCPLRYANTSSTINWNSSTSHLYFVTNYSVYNKLTTTAASVTLTDVNNAGFNFYYTFTKYITYSNGGNMDIISQLDSSFPYSDIKYSYTTVAQINALKSVKTIVFCVATGRWYKYVASGAAYTVDNDYVLATADGGNTRFVSLDYPTLSQTNILTITDANVATYVGDGGSGNNFIINVPITTDIISVETTSPITVYGVQYASGAYNGKRVRLLGDLYLIYAVDAADTSSGRFSARLLEYMSGTSGGSGVTKLLDAYQDFMYWNGKQFSKAY